MLHGPGMSDLDNERCPFCGHPAAGYLPATDSGTWPAYYCLNHVADGMPDTAIWPARHADA